MNRKIKSTLGLLGLLIFILVTGGVYLFIIQHGKINDKSNQLAKLKANHYDTAQLNVELNQLSEKAVVLDSILASRKFNVPQNLSSIKFFNFVNKISTNFSANTKTNIEYIGRKSAREFYYYEYKISGSGTFNDLFELVYAIEQSKELKKVNSVTLSNQITTDKDGMPLFLISFNLNADVYYSDNDRFSTKDLVENNLKTNSIYDIFYPLIRNEIPPNVNNLLDVQGAKLLALIPEGAFLSDNKGDTYLLWEGQPVYLGYLTKIDYDHNMVSFILNKGGIIEKVDLSLQKDGINKNK